MAQEEEFEYGSAPGTPRTPKTPKSLERYNEEKKKKNGLKKLLTLAKKIPNLDKSPSASGRFENILQNDEGGGSVSRRRGLSSLFKRKPKDDDSGTVTPTRELQAQGPMKKDKEEKTISGEKEKAQDLVEKPELNGKERNEASREESKPSKLNPPTAAEATVEEPKLPEIAKEDDHKHPHKQTEDVKVDSKEHQELEATTNQELEHGHHQHHHHIQTEDPKGDTKEQEVVAESEALQEKSRDVDYPPPTLGNQEKEAVGCESIAEGFQKMCLPWTVKKEEDH